MNLRQTIRQYYPFIKYCIVGGLGTFIDLFTVYLLVELLFLSPVFASFFGFLLAVINNFLLNKSWTFRNTSTNYRKLWIKFLLVSIGGLMLTLALMYLMTEVLSVYYLLAKAATSIVVLFWNFTANKYWTFKTSEHFVHLPKKYNFEYSIVIPAYNEENRIKNSLIIIDEYLKTNQISAEIIVVSDGSTDSTGKIVEELKQKIEHLTLICEKINHGKGYAVKIGVEASRGEYILMTDADNSTPIEELKPLRKRMGNREIAIGSRYLKDSHVKVTQPKYRIFIGRLGNTLIRFFLLEGVHDTQCGFKLFEHHAAKEIFSRQKVFGFAFDIEVLSIAKSLDYQVVEVPVSWFNSVESRVRPIRDALRTLIDIIYIKLNLWSGRYE